MSITTHFYSYTLSLNNYRYFLNTHPAYFKYRHDEEEEPIEDEKFHHQDIAIALNLIHEK